MLRGLFFALALLAVFGGAFGCSGQGQVCTLLGCTDGVSVAGTVAKGGNKLAIKICVNGQCQSGDANVSSTAINNCGSVGTPSASSLCFSPTLGANTWTVSGFVSLDTPKNGDHYVLTITDATTGAVLGSADVHVNYDPQYPNGPNCGVACETGKLTVSPT